jgi:hypothetical protein
MREFFRRIFYPTAEEQAADEAHLQWLRNRRRRWMNSALDYRIPVDPE